VLQDKQRRNDSTTGNNATSMQMAYLARLFEATKDTRFRDAFQQAVAYCSMESAIMTPNSSL
jgi:hypothetical protein